ncbi:MAG: aminotransferase class V-fold PLP-dependent enzyme [Spirochaetales bacterium]|jgi:isopenicillin-N epimerase|nr:aminotransferase class V-fold PLP-dependent enzyme [Spirochaetales bacterium]
MNNLRELFLLRPEVVFFNHGSFGACPRQVFEVYQRWQRDLEGQPVEFIQRRLRDLMVESRGILGEYVGADGDDLVYVTNASTAINIVARSISLEPGDEVLTTDHEYGSMNRVWELVCEKQRARYVQSSITLPAVSQDQIVEELWSGVTSRTKVIFFSHITAPSALTLPVAELVSRARKAGIIVVVDGAHAPGQIPLNLEELGADFYAGNCHKWMMAPKGAGFLYARREMQHLLEPLIGGRSGKAAKGSKFITEHQYHGTRDYSTFLSVPEAIRFMKENAWSDVSRSCHELGVFAREQVAALTGVPQTTPNDVTWFSQMAALHIPPCNTRKLKQRLLDEYSIEVPTTGWNGQLYVRLSVQGYNTRGEVETLIRALAALLPECAVEP